MPTAQLIYAASESDADLLYATKLSVPDPFLWFSVGGKTRIVMSRLEVDRARANAEVDEVLAVDDFINENSKERGAAALILALAKKYKFRAVEVPENFSFGIAAVLMQRGVKVRARAGMFFPERQIKTKEEIVHITHAQRLAEVGMARGFEVLRASKIGKKDVLQWGGGALTSERLRGEIDATIMREGGLPANTIVAGGDQGCDPHERGHGLLRGNEAIIIDIFPRDQKSGYFGDLTRTVVKGRPTAKLEHMYATVAEGKEWVLKRLKAGVDGAAMHRELTARFAKAGYPTEQRRGRWVGFFHGTGHSLGLEIHEAPRFGAGKFRVGCVMTVEPGLYFPGIGGVRLEDLVVIGAKSARNLTRVEQRLRL